MLSSHNLANQLPLSSFIFAVTAFDQAFIGWITSQPAHIVIEGMRQPNIYMPKWDAEHQRHFVESIDVSDVF